MTFIEKLEVLLLDSNLGIYCKIKEYTNGVKAFLLNCEQTNYSPIIHNQQEHKESGIKEMMSLLKDPLNFKNGTYTHYSLDFLDEKNGKDIFNKIVELNPTDDELINLYKHTAFSFGFKLAHFLEVLKNKESIIKLMSVGYDGKYDYVNQSSYLRYCLYYLSNKDFSDDEYSEMIKNFVKNSISIKETEEEIINIIVVIIEDIEKAQKLIFDLTNKDISIKGESIEKKVIKLQMNDFLLIKKFGLDDSKEISEFLNQFDIEINRNLEILSDTISIKYYSQKAPNNYRLSHNLIIENFSGNTEEINKLLDRYYNYCYDNCEYYNSLNDLIQILKDNPSIFRKIVFDTFMPPSAAKEDKKPVKV